MITSASRAITLPCSDGKADMPVTTRNLTRAAKIVVVPGASGQDRDGAMTTLL
jgi:hypothetical protein